MCKSQKYKDVLIGNPLVVLGVERWVAKAIHFFLKKPGKKFGRYK